MQAYHNSCAECGILMHPYQQHKGRAVGKTMEWYKVSSFCSSIFLSNFCWTTIFRFQKDLATTVEMGTET